MPDRASNSSSKTAKHIGSEIGLPYLNVLPDGAAPQPQASLLQCSLNLKAFHLCLSLSLFYLKNESEMSNETLSLSLFKTLSDSIFLTMIVCCFCLTLFITLLIFASVFGFIHWCWCWWDTINCLFLLVLVSFGENREMQLIGFIWLALVLWLGAMGH